MSVDHVSADRANTRATSRVKSRTLVGLMSGTSLDGISAAVVRFTARDDDEAPHAELLAFDGRAYRPEERARLEEGMRGGTARDYCRLNADLGDWLADAAIAAIAQSGVARGDIDAIASHGQTLWHEVGHSTWQIGDAARIAERTGCAVVSDFRTRDVAAGGQGAPLVSVADLMLFAHATKFRALQNIGGIGNVSIVPPRAGTRVADARVRAFDTGPGVVLIDAMTRRIRPDLAFDRDGEIAAQGTPVERVVHEMLADPYFAQEPPKSTGRELFTPAYADAFHARCREAGAGDADTVATAVVFTARSIASQYGQFIAEPLTDVVLSGGGAKNPVLVAAIQRELAHAHPGVPVVTFDRLFFDGEAKEAVAFALLGYLHLEGRAGNVPSATGARGPRPLGVLTPATVTA